MKKTIGLFIVFFSVYALFISSTLTQGFDYTSADYRTFFGLLALYVFMSLFPIPLNNTTITFDTALSLAVFLIYGFYVEAWLMQLSIFLMLFFLGVRNLKRYMVNLLMFLFISFFSAQAYYWVAGSNEHPASLQELSYIGVLAFIITSFLVNELLLFVGRWLLYDRWELTSFAETTWDIAANTIVAPLGLLLYIFYEKNGQIAIIYFGLPFLVITLLFRLYNEINQVNVRLNRLTQHSFNFSAKLHTNETLAAIFSAIADLFPNDYMYILEYDSQNKHLLPLGIKGELTKEQEEQFLALRIKAGDGLSGRAALEQKLLRSSVQYEQAHFHNEPDFIAQCKSIMCVPMIRNNQTIGVITILHRNKAVYSKYDEYLIQVLANQAGVALYNARQYELTRKKMYLDELTGVENYRSFDQQIYRELEKCKKDSKCLSLLVIDIDHFKEVNDTFGHLVGNQVLITIASFLRNFFEPHGKVFRYGGEEFTVILPDVDESSAKNMAEEIRRKIESLSIPITDQMSPSDKKELRVTVSIGVATYPTQATEALDLIRNADRAMYLGAKQAGRNRVGVYVS